MNSNEQRIELNLCEIKKVELDLLIQFHIICLKCNFRYSLGGGTLLGAIRHAGFIPWDDDIDVMMPRPDYEAFIDYCISHEDIPFRLFSYETVKDYINLESKISSLDTVIIDSSLNNLQVPLGIYIDVFPIDGLGMSKSQAYYNYFKTSLKREVLNAKTWQRYFKSKTHGIFFEPVRLVLYAVSRFANSRKMITSIEYINKALAFDESNYSACVCGAYRTKEIMETGIFKEFIDVEFEGKQFHAIKDYDSYLKNLYGDYMVLPPEDKQKSHHSFVAYKVSGSN